MFHEYTHVLDNYAKKFLDIQLSPTQADQFCLYGDLLLEWNKTLNLTRITDPHEIVVKHFIDSLSLGKHIRGTNLADIGTGAGFPGLPLKILKPELDVVLVDSLAKRLNFLNVVIDRLGLTGIQTVHARAEEFGRDKKYRETFDIGVARAVAGLPILIEYVFPVLKVKGCFLASKGSKGEEEILQAEQALSLLHGKVTGIEHLNFGQEAENHMIIIIEKEKPTPGEFPRKAGIPAKKPL